MDGRVPQNRGTRVTSMILMSLTALLVIENPQIATPQTPAAQVQPSDSTSPAPTKKPAPPSTDTESDILLILKEEKESISRGLGKEEPISQAPSNVYVITDEDIRHSGATDIPTLLRRVPGMEVMQMTGADFNVSVRGNNQTAANHLLVLVDGRPIYEYAFGSTFWSLLPVTLPEIKKIEVMKGPSAAIYGFNAYDGVVNIVTKTPHEMKGNTKGTFVQFGGGELGTIRSTAIQAGTHGDFGYRLSFGHDQNQKWSDRNSLALRSNKFNLLTDYTLNDGAKVSLSGGLVSSNRYDGQVFDAIHELSQISNGYVAAAYERPNFFIRTSWTRWQRSSLELLAPQVLNSIATLAGTDGSINQRFNNDVYTTWVQHAVDVTATNRVIYGVNYFHNAVSNQTIFSGSPKEDRVGLYLQNEWRATSTLTVVPGFRWDMLTGLNPSYSPRLSLIYKPYENHTFRTSASVSYRPPSLLESRGLSFQTFFSTPPAFIVSGSPNLTPEQIVSYEAGYQGWFLNHRLQIRGDVFFNHLSNFISSATPTPQGVAFANAVGTADLYGGEVGAEFLVTPWLTGFANYSTVQVHQTSDLIAAQSFNGTRGAPSYKINAGLRGEWDSGFNAETLVHFVSAASYPVSLTHQFAAPFFGYVPPSNNVGSYTLLNTRVAYRFWHDKAEVAVSAFNALNDQHRENPIGDVISSRVMGWLTLRY